MEKMQCSSIILVEFLTLYCTYVPYFAKPRLDFEFVVGRRIRGKDYKSKQKQ